MKDMAEGKCGEGKCGGGNWRKNNSGNVYRAKHDDGSRQSRRKTGSGSRKHRSTHTRGG